MSGPRSSKAHHHPYRQPQGPEGIYRPHQNPFHPGTSNTSDLPPCTRGDPLFPPHQSPTNNTATRMRTISMRSRPDIPATPVIGALREPPTPPQGLDNQPRLQEQLPMLLPLPRIPSSIGELATPSPSPLPYSGICTPSLETSP